MWDQAVHVFRRRYVVDFIRCVAGEQDHRTGDSLELRFGEVPDRVRGGKGCGPAPHHRAKFLHVHAQ